MQTREEFFEFAKNKTGEIYSARRGTVTVFIIEGNIYLIHNLNNSKPVINPSFDYWIHSIDYACSFLTYYTFQMCPPGVLTYDAKPIVPFTAEHIAILKSLVKTDITL